MPTADEIKSFINDALADNTTRAITEEVLRDTLTELVDWTTEYNPTWVSRGTWSSATAYVVNDYVTSGGSTYRCKVNHTNQAVTNTTYWELVAAKGETGANGSNVRNLSGGLVRNSALENFSMDGITVSSGVTLDLTILQNVYPSLKFINGAVANTVAYWSQRFYINRTRLYRMRFMAGIMAGTPNSQVSARIRCYDKNNAVVNYGRGDTSAVYTNPTITATVGSFQEIEIFVGGLQNDLVGGNTTGFHSDAVWGELAFHSITINSTVNVANLIVDEMRLNDYVPHNLPFLPEGQHVYDATNRAKRGVYVNSVVGIVWLNKEIIPLQPNGTSISMVVNRPYKWTWALIYNDGVTTVTLPSTTINASTNATFVLTGTAGKTYTIVIYPSV